MIFFLFFKSVDLAEITIAGMILKSENFFSILIGLGRLRFRGVAPQLSRFVKVVSCVELSLRELTMLTYPQGLNFWRARRSGGKDGD